MSFSSGAYRGSHSTVIQDRSASAALDALLVWAWFKEGLHAQPG